MRIWGVMVAALAMLLVGCGAITDAVEEAQAADAAGDDGYVPASERSGTVEFDPSVGWRVTGPDGTTIDVEDTYTVDGFQEDQSNTYTIENGERRWLFTAFVDETSTEVTVTSGGPVLFEMLIGNVVEGDEFGEMNIIEIVDQVELAVNETATLSAVRPEP